MPEPAFAVGVKARCGYALERVDERLSAVVGVQLEPAQDAAEQNRAPGASSEALDGGVKGGGGLPR